MGIDVEFLRTLEEKVNHAVCNVFLEIKAKTFGMTPLREARNLAAALGMRKLWVKDDSANPTHSFKDRVVSVALSAGCELWPSIGPVASACIRVLSRINRSRNRVRTR